MRTLVLLLLVCFIGFISACHHRGSHGHRHHHGGNHHHHHGGGHHHHGGGHHHHHADGHHHHHGDGQSGQGSQQKGSHQKPGRHGDSSEKNDMKCPLSFGECVGDGKKQLMCGLLGDVRTVKFEAEGRTFHYVDHDVRTVTSADKFCHLHMRGRLARINTESIHKNVNEWLVRLKKYKTNLDEIWIGGFTEEKLNTMITPGHFSLNYGPHCIMISSWSKEKGDFSNGCFHMFSKKCSHFCTAIKPFICETTEVGGRDYEVDFTLDGRRLTYVDVSVGNVDLAHRYCEKEGRSLVQVDGDRFRLGISDQLHKIQASKGNICQVWVAGTTSSRVGSVIQPNDLGYQGSGSTCAVMSNWWPRYQTGSADDFRLFGRACNDGKLRTFICEHLRRSTVRA